MPTIKKRKAKRTEAPTMDLTEDRLIEMVAGPGILNDLKGYRNDEERKQAWLNNRRRIMKRVIQHGGDCTFSNYYQGTRPWAWWKFEAKVERPGSFQEEFAYLQENKLLLPGETFLKMEA